MPGGRERFETIPERHCLLQSIRGRNVTNLTPKPSDNDQRATTSFGSVRAPYHAPGPERGPILRRLKAATEG